MIYGLIHPGSGLGNSLHRYIATRTLALDKGYDFAMIGQGYFKGSEFMKPDFGKEPKFYVSIEGGGKIQVREDIPLWEEETKYYNPDFNFIEDNTIIDGEFQDSRYFEHRLPEIRKWLWVEPMDIDDDTCVINFRGGEYVHFPDLFLTQEYWDKAIKMMKDKGVEHFVVATDDVFTAKQFFPDYECIHNIGENWRMIRYAPNLILSNSSFAILPALLNTKAQNIIAPRYWNRRNIGKWEYPQNYYKRFTYI